MAKEQKTLSELVLEATSAMALEYCYNSKQMSLLPDWVMEAPRVTAAERIAMKFIAADPAKPQWNQIPMQVRDDLIRIINTLIVDGVIVPGPNQ